MASSSASAASAASMTSSVLSKHAPRPPLLEHEHSRMGGRRSPVENLPLRGPVPLASGVKGREEVALDVADAEPFSAEPRELRAGEAVEGRIGIDCPEDVEQLRFAHECREGCCFLVSCSLVANGTAACGG